MVVDSLCDRSIDCRRFTVSPDTLVPGERTLRKPCAVSDRTHAEFGTGQGFEKQANLKLCQKCCPKEPRTVV